MPKPGEEGFTRDPMELDEDHFQKEQIEQEEMFTEQFKEHPLSDDPGGMLPENQKEIIEGEENKELTPEQIAAAKELEEQPFKFDESLAEAEKEELKEVNERLNTNFDSMKELKDSIANKDNKEDIQQIREDENFVAYFEKTLKYDNKKIVLEDKKMLAQQANKDITNQDVIDEINEEVELLEENGSLEYVARSIKTEIEGILKTKKASIQKFNNDKNLSIEQSQKKVKEDVEASINEIFKKGEFFGIKPSRQDMLDVYTDVTKNKHIDHLRANPSEAVEYALFRKYKEVILKNLGKPNYKAGVKNTLEELGIEGSKQTGKPGTETKESQTDKKSYLEEFIK